MTSKLKQPMTHLFIPDTQHGPGRVDNHLWWIGHYIVDQFAGKPLRIIHAGDHADMASLSSYERKGGVLMEGRRYVADIDAANAGWDALNTPLYDYNRGRRKKWEPDKHITLGNHEHRIVRAVELDATLEGAVSLDHLNYRRWGWKVHQFLAPVWLDGVAYAHYFYNPMTGRPYAGENLKLRLQRIGHSFTMGHQQTFDTAIRYVGGRQQRALVAGSCYLHDEDYKGPQGNAHWRGILVCHQVHDGAYDLMEVSLDYLCRKYEGMSLETFVRKFVD
jgi:hypothetical protein